jgi:hypothetical protein
MFALTQSNGIAIYEAQTRKELMTLHFDNSAGATCRFSPDDKILAVCRGTGRHGRAKTLRLYDVSTGKDLHHAEVGGLYAPLAFTRDSRLLAIVDFSRWVTMTGFMSSMSRRASDVPTT